MNIIIAIIFSFYIIITMLMLFGLRKKNRIVNKKLYNFSIVVAVKNEEKDIEKLLESLKKINYPKEKLEIIIVDNSSEDDTVKVINRFIKKDSHIKLIQLYKNESNTLKGKLYALQQGILKSNGEIILITDGDCKVPSSWVASYNSKFTEKIGLVAGNISLIAGDKKTTMFTKIQNLDWIFLQTISTGTAEINLPVSMLGGNFAIRKETYIDIGGFEKMGFSITEDMKLIQEVHKQKFWEIHYSDDDNILISTVPTKNIREFITQRKRWAMGSTDVTFWGITLQLIATVNHLLIAFGFLLPINKLLLLCGIGAILFSDFILLFKQLSKFKMRKLLLYFFHYKVFFILYIILFIPIVLFSKKVVWKGEEYKVKKKN